MGIEITSTVVHSIDEHVSVTKLYKAYIPFTLWGAIGTDMNIIDAMHNMTRPEIKLFKELVDNLDARTHTATLPQLSTASLSSKRSSTMKLLIDKKFLKKTGQRTWMFNPYLLIPEKSIREIILIQWESLP